LDGFGHIPCINPRNPELDQPLSSKILLTFAAIAGLLFSSQATALTTFAMLDAEQVVALNPASDPTGTNGWGLSLGSMTLSRNRLTFFVNWNELTSNALAVSVHGPAGVGENGPVLWSDSWSGEDERVATDGFTIGVWSGIGESQIQDLLNGHWYMQIATAGYGTGEIRGQIVTTRYFREHSAESHQTGGTTPLPEPSAAAVFALGLWVVSGAVRRRSAT
jgi:hypothetical protein